ncbi:MAG: Ubiquitin thioesterase [Chlamydiia bacterium]|nr:Ubiquitin thioesterase [Chlamydiia bacterium]
MSVIVYYKKGAFMIPPQFEPADSSSYGLTAKPAEFAQEIQNNLGKLQKTIQQQIADPKSSTLTEEDLKAFFDIIGKDIAVLEKRDKSSPKIEQLQNKLIELKDIVESARESPFVGEKISLVERAKGYTAESAVAKGLQALDSKYQMLPIKGDGHCLFRSVSVGLISILVKKSDEERAKYFKDLQATFTDSSLQEKLTAFQKFIEESPSKKDSKLIPFLNSAKANIPVDFLRSLACDYNRKNASKEVLNVMAQANGLSSGEEYLKSMSDPSQAKYGDELEIQALAAALGIKVRVENVAVAGRGGRATTQYSPLSSTNDEVVLLFRSQHYDLGIKKQ